MAYLVNRETGDKVDSTLVTTPTLQFKGTVDQPFYARILVGDKRGPSFIVEPGKISIDKDGNCKSTKLNVAFETFKQDYTTVAQSLDTIKADSVRIEVINRFNARVDSTMKAHINDPVGRIIFLDKASETRSLGQLDSLLAIYPQFSSLKTVQDIAKGHRAAAATAPGKKFTDFTVNYEGKAQRLSDYAGKGKWLLVDFWASWCGPCRRAMPMLKELYTQYNDKGLDILGVAVWDNPEDSKRAAAQMKLPWPQILDAQKIPTDLYGIYGIPHLMLISPDGTIVARGIEGNELREAVANALSAPAAGSATQSPTQQ